MVHMVCSRCGHDMELRIVATKTDSSVVEFVYFCPRCRNAVVVERLVIKRDGSKGIRIARSLLRHG